MEIEFANQKKKMVLSKPVKIKNILKKLKINPEDYIIKRNNELCHEEDTAKNKDKIFLIPVISGG